MLKKGNSDLPPLSIAVKRVREAYNDTLQRFAQRAGISMDSVSRFERGRVPKDSAVLLKLAVVAEMKELAAEAEAFHEAANEAERARRVDDIYQPIIPPSSVRSLGLSAHNAEAWRLMVIARMAALYHPEAARAMAEAAGAVSAFVDAVLQEPESRALGYVELEYRVSRAFEQQALLELKQQKKNL
jgi:transcriptional regulator with XRE-family HTH domain